MADRAMIDPDRWRRLWWRLDPARAREVVDAYALRDRDTLIDCILALAAEWEPAREEIASLRRRLVACHDRLGLIWRLLERSDQAGALAELRAWREGSGGLA